MIHRLKIDQVYLDNLISGDKKCDVRINDKDYQKGDILEFKEYKSNGKVFTYHFRITHIHYYIGLSFNHVALSLESKKIMDW